MRTRKIAIALAASALLALPVASMAKLVGQCGDCHTMHNSYKGQPVAKTFGVTGTSWTPNAVLLKMDCLSCHAQGGTDNIVSLAGGSQIPQVYHTNATDLAAGNFGYITGLKTSTQTGSDSPARKGHNPAGLTTADATLLVPPGFSRGAENGGNVSSNWHPGNWTGRGYIVTSTDAFAAAGNDLHPTDGQINCAGYLGCHGIRNQLVTVGTGTVITVWRTNLAAMTGAHHINDPGATGVKDPSATMATLTVTDASAGNLPNLKAQIIAESYRFLWGVKGYGNQTDKWQNKDSGSHNEYFGKQAAGMVTLGTTTTVALDAEMYNSVEGCERCHEGGHGATDHSLIKAPDNTMSGFCGTCHSKFHTGALVGSTAFVRHPSDYQIQNKTEYKAYTSYDITAPVARPTLYTAANATVTPGTDLVMCLSCHEAHATPYDSMLRFDYSKMIAGNAAAADQNHGCFACHTAKDTGAVPAP